MKTAFNINFRPEIEAGKFKVVTADGRPVTIQRWDMKGNYPILACTMVKQCNWEGDESWDEERPFAYDKDGHAAGTAPADKLELFLISEDPELTESEYAVQEIFYKGRETDIDLLKKTIGTLLKVARKQLTAELPRWKKVKGENYAEETRLVRKCDGSYTLATDHTLYPEDTIEGKASEYYIAITELEKLPKEE